MQDTLLGQRDVFITKLNSSGSSLVYSTFLGGTGNEAGEDIAIDTFGAAYITGETSSGDFPILNATQTIKQGTNDAFVTKLSSTGNSLVYSTYLGGTSNEHGFSISVDVSGSAFVTGETQSINFPTLNPYQGTYQDFQDAYITKFTNSGTIVYSTYLGGNGTETGYGIALDASGSAYVTGRTTASTFPVVNPFQVYQVGFDIDVFVSKFIEDSDGDGVPDGSDNCPNELNPLQLDTDSDSKGDVCDCCLWKRGNVNGGSDDGTFAGSVDIADLVYLVAFMFQGGNAPICIEEADINGSGGSPAIDISDLVALVAFMFQGGSEPASCP